MLELYAAYWDVNDMREFNEALIERLVSVVTDGGTSCRSAAHGVVRASVRAHDVSRRSRNLQRRQVHARTRARPGRRRRDPAGVGSSESPTHGHALDKIFERVLEPHLVQPTFVTEYRS